MSYVPPHARKTKLVKEVKEFKKEFPQLAPPLLDDKPKLDFKKLFKNNEKRRQAKAKRMRWGMIKLTREGNIIDSLSAEERTEEERKREEYWKGIHLEKLGNRLERDHLRRLEEDEDYDPDEIVTSSSESEPESEDSESSHAEDPEDDEF
jgi:hypothetical protein